MSAELATGPRGSVTIADAALQQVVVQAVEAVEGARARRGRRRLSIDVEDGRVRAEVELGVAYGRVLPDVARAVQESVAGALATMCGFTVDAVDVSVEELDR